MKGAAIATVSSITLSFAIGFLLLLKGKAAIRNPSTALVVLNRTIDFKTDNGRPSFRYQSVAQKPLLSGFS